MTLNIAVMRGGEFLLWLQGPFAVGFLFAFMGLGFMLGKRHRR